MPHLVQLQRRLTFKYVPAYDHLDRWEITPYRAKFLQPRRVEDPYEDGGFLQIQPVTFNRPIRRKEAQELLSAALARGCACEHDCCGHLHGGLHRLHRLTPRKFIAVSHYAPNY